MTPAPVLRLSPLTIDGNTRARLQGAPLWRGPWGPWVHRLREPVSRAAERASRRRGGRLVELPAEPPAGASEAVVSVSGARRHIVSIHAPGHAFVRVNHESGEVELQWEARALWSAGYAATASSWLAYVSRLVGVGDIDPWSDAGGSSCAAAAGWRITGVELCADYQGPGAWREDAGRFTGSKRGQAIERRQLEQCDGTGHDECPTVNIGTRGSAWSLCWYDKTQQARGPKLETYAPTWRANGWRGGQVWRVEVRATGRGLQLDGLSFRDPRTLADPSALSSMWATVTHRRRLVEPGAARSNRAQLDPRWLAVQGFARDGEQMRRAPATIDEAAALERCNRTMQRAAVRAAVLEARARGEQLDADGLVDAMRDAFAGALAQLDGEGVAELADYAKAYSRQLGEH